MIDTADYIKMHKNSGIEIGDKVKLLRSCKDEEQGWNSSFPDEFCKYVGLVGEVINDYKESGFGVSFCYRDNPPITLALPWFVLEIVEKRKPKSNIDKYKSKIRKGIYGYIKNNKSTSKIISDFVKILIECKTNNPEWISVDNYLPKPNQQVICTDNDGSTLEIGFRSELDSIVDNHIWIDFPFKVYYWCPIPDVDDIKLNSESCEI